MLAVATCLAFAAALGHSPAALAGAPTVFASASGTCDDVNGADWNTAPIGSARDDYLVRFTTGAEMTFEIGGFGGPFRSVEGPDVAWFALNDLPGSAPVSGDVSCGVDASFSIEFLDLPTTPATFSGKTTPNLIYPNQLAYRAPGDGEYVADISLAGGTLILNPDGSDERVIASSGTYPIGYLTEGIDYLGVKADDGPQAQWSMTVRALPVQLSNPTWTRKRIEPGDVVRLEYEASGDTRLDAVITNTNGEVVRTLADDLRIESGNRTLTWDGRLASGANAPDDRYTARLVSHDFSGQTTTAQASIVVNTPPETRFTKKPKKKVRTRGKKAKRVRFAFESNEQGAEFECDVKGGWTPCTSPQRYKLKRGKYRYAVRAIDRFGEKDPTPETWRFRVK